MKELARQQENPRNTFSKEAVVDHLRRKHPGCPDFAVSFFSEEIARKEWQGATLGKAVGVTMQSCLRHQMTDYETLLLNGMDREEARARVQPRIDAMLKVWRKKPKSKNK
ncbi:hypothetical protein ASE36_03500 [Rhizobium sp. Root274]|nr:hypothetical protein ASC71_03500 [Rhizobium sp. Root1240]KRD33842.1 hypothetical protein ASE36_03500 [Rhizobium sp. Root274]